MEYRSTQSSNISKEGKQSYRVRKMVNGLRHSKSFNRYKKAVEYRNELNQIN